MALTRKLLRELGLEEEVIGRIIEAHTESTEALKAERDTAAGELASVRAQAEEERRAHEQYRLDAEKRRDTDARKTAYRALLSQAGIADRYLDSVLRVSDVSALPFEDGKITDAETRCGEIRREWADFVVSTHTRGTDTPTPPEHNAPDYDGMSDAEYYHETYRK